MLIHFLILKVSHDNSSMTVHKPVSLWIVSAPITVPPAVWMTHLTPACKLGLPARQFKNHLQSSLIFRCSDRWVFWTHWYKNMFLYIPVPLINQTETGRLDRPLQVIVLSGLGGWEIQWCQQGHWWWVLLEERSRGQHLDCCIPSQFFSSLTHKHTLFNY